MILKFLPINLYDANLHSKGSYTWLARFESSKIVGQKQYIKKQYSGENKYLDPCRFRKFGHLQRNVWSIILMVGVF